MENQQLFSISGHFYGLDDVSRPKHIRLQDANLKTVRSFWIQDRSFKISDLTPGLYELRTRDGSGNEEFMAVDLSERSSENLVIGSFKAPTHRFQVTKEVPLARKNSPRSRFMTPGNLETKSFTFQVIELEMVNFQNDDWSFVKLPSVSESVAFSPSYSYSFTSSYQASFLRVSSRNYGIRLICLPKDAKLQVRFNILPGQSNPLEKSFEVLVNTDYNRAEVLLDMLNAGAMLEAKSFVNANLAEDLLQDKILNPWAAAIGAYYLLRMKDYERLHNWANNLANWFDWLPDGPIIHAWQMIAEVREGETKKIHQIRNRLLEAQKRGLPVFTEGLRLLLEGLSQFSVISHKKDKAIELALLRVKAYASFADWDCKYLTLRDLGTTLNGWTIPDTMRSNYSYNNSNENLNTSRDDF